eukprot:705538-Rhodomonas_salina.1
MPPLPSSLLPSFPSSHPLSPPLHLSVLHFASFSFPPFPPSSLPLCTRFHHRSWRAAQAEERSRAQGGRYQRGRSKCTPLCRRVRRTLVHVPRGQ